MVASLSPDGRYVSWQGVAEWEHRGPWVQPWRIPRCVVASAGSAGLTSMARMPAGTRLVVETDARSVSLGVRVVPVGGGAAPVDFVVDGELVGRARPDGDGRVRFTVPVPAEPRARVRRVELWLPQWGEVQVSDLSHDGTVVVRPEPERVRWTTYGSSITQGRAADGPSETWPALVSRERGWEHTNLGFHAECHLDPGVVRHVRDVPAELVSLCLGVNIHGQATLGRRALPSQVCGAIETIREGQPDVPIVVITPVVAPGREHERNGVGLTLRDVRSLVADAASTLQRLGDPRLSVVDGLDLLGPGDAGLLPDGLHPGPEGIRLLASRIGPHLDAALARR